MPRSIYVQGLGHCGPVFAALGDGLQRRTPVAARHRTHTHGIIRYANCLVAGIQKYCIVLNLSRRQAAARNQRSGASGHRRKAHSFQGGAAQREEDEQSKAGHTAWRRFGSDEIIGTLAGDCGTFNDSVVCI